MRNLSAFVGILSLAVIATPAYAATTVTTAGSSTFDFGCLGTSPSCGENFGQTFVAPNGDNTLTSATFYLELGSGSSPLNYAFRIFAWDGSRQVGPALFDSGSLTLTSTTYQALTFAPNLGLTPDQQYVALFATAGLGNSDSQYANQQITGERYAGGAFGFQRDDNGAAWEATYPGQYDALFTLNFGISAVPEPDTWALMLLGFGMIGLAVRRKRSRKAHLRQFA